MDMMIALRAAPGVAPGDAAHETAGLIRPPGKTVLIVR